MLKKIKRCWNYFILYTNSYNCEFDPDWDNQINDLMDRYYFSNIEEYMATIQGRRVWISNYPYAYGLLTDSNTISFISGRPSRKTILRIKNEIYKQRNK